MNVYVAYQDDNDYGGGDSLLEIFLNKDDADAYELGDYVDEVEVREGPVKVGRYHYLTWYVEREDRAQGEIEAANPHWLSQRRNLPDPIPDVEVQWSGGHWGRMLHLRGYNLAAVTDRYEWEREQYLADPANRAKVKPWPEGWR